MSSYIHDLRLGKALGGETSPLISYWGFRFGVLDTPGAIDKLAWAVVK